MRFWAIGWLRNATGFIINLVWGSWDKIPLSHHLLVFLPHKSGHLFSFADIKCHPYSKYWILGGFFKDNGWRGASTKAYQKIYAIPLFCLWGWEVLPFKTFFGVSLVLQWQIKSKISNSFVQIFCTFSQKTVGMTNRGWDLQVLQTLVTGRKTSRLDQETIKASDQKNMEKK